MIEETFVMIKPDGVKRGLIGEIISRFERKLMSITELRMLTLTRELAEELYAEHKGRDYFEKLINYSISGPVVVMKIVGENAIMNCRILVGDTYPEKRVPGSIRGDFSPYLTENVVHASSSKEDAERELRIFFG
ncbi:nucleoside-diphosphate kinase [Caldisericum exile]|uniref:Nucleoside diphosphate kinase n=1 Tax=Caldisericum exile (strain DSM 21853 / NBRC 104410 / AZM16c01) TaxID=511051 RepID=A0A7U6GET5_CALEA|nr:nucleoside-diphosphate kinase [Caldisericum exile]BAL81061.1 nucleoside diphosphate kinase [Caldisericum exile AZM16c01]